ncbi:MAG: hypothetical protein AB3N23_10475 [Paracoccaceae bacterium]
MSDHNVDFDRRVRKLNRKHDAIARGYTTKIRKDGLIVVKPQRARIKLPMNLILGLVAGLVLFKAVLMGSMGAASYDARVAKLSGGTPVEQAGAFVMQADPLSGALANWMAPYLNG